MSTLFRMLATGFQLFVVCLCYLLLQACTTVQVLTSGKEQTDAVRRVAYKGTVKDNRITQLLSGLCSIECIQSKKSIF